MRVSPGSDGLRIVDVLLPLALDKLYSYHWPHKTNPVVGDIVCVPWGKRMVQGVVWRIGGDTLPSFSLKHAGDVHPLSPFSELLVLFIDWLSRYTLTPRGVFLKMALPSLQHPPHRIPLYGLGKNTFIPPEKSTKKKVFACEKRLVGYLQKNPWGPREELQKTCKVSKKSFEMLLEKKVVQEEKERWNFEKIPQPIPRIPHLLLSEAQKKGSSLLSRNLHGFSVTLLEGVTGSGKTEVYFQAIFQILQKNSQAMVLLPEISLTKEWVQRFEKVFGFLPYLWHGRLSHQQRSHTWHSVLSGHARVVVGARSALFLPFPSLGLIVVDEEHDGSYKQEERGIYHARDGSVMRGKIHNIPVVLVSATPSLETVWNVQKKRYHHVVLKTRYHHKASLAPIFLISPPQASQKSLGKQWVSSFLYNKLREALQKKEQGLLYINRRGYAPLVLCKACGHRFLCPHCQVWLVWHRSIQRLRCHHCTYDMVLPSLCPECQAPNALHGCGPGVERIVEEVKHHLPHARIAMVSGDTTHHHQILSQMKERALDILIGTQLVTKGHHFPYLTCVGIVDGDESLHGSDLRACEKTYQLLSQVAGRAGRQHHPGFVYLQTHHPLHPVFQALSRGKTDDFVCSELQSRSQHNLPPFYRLVSLVISSAHPEKGQGYVDALAKHIPFCGHVEVLGPSPAPLWRFQGRARWRFLIKAPRDFFIQGWLKEWLLQFPPPFFIDQRVDVDPYTFL